ncbi:MAG: radical SAM protein [Clostridiales bacterium]|nr:radical SAM protein [Clostridiales bacterium]
MYTCNLCPRRCNAVRTDESGDGFCGMGMLPLVSRAAPHMWEEPCISGTKGSGTVFFSGCSLGCVFCQNEPISHRKNGRMLNAKQLSVLFRRVEELGVHNLNLVSPTHFAPVILEALSLRKPGIPVVWNTSGYEDTKMIRQAKGLVDIYLPDFKYASEKTAAQLADAPDYFEATLEAIKVMCQQTGLPVYDEDGLMLSGTLVRHLILPLRVGESIHILDTIAQELPKGTPVSLMRQYTPMNGVNLPGLDRRLTAREYIRVRDHMLSLDLPGYLQQKEAADSAYTPAFMDKESLRLLEDL